VVLTQVQALQQQQQAQALQQQQLQQQHHTGWNWGAVGVLCAVCGLGC
jgi:hypothetical protein